MILFQYSTFLLPLASAFTASVVPIFRRENMALYLWNRGSVSSNRIFSRSSTSILDVEGAGSTDL